MNSDSKKYSEQRQEAFKLFIEAWELKEIEISQATERELIKIESELIKIKKDLASNESKILSLEKENENLTQTLAVQQAKNMKLRTFKENLKKSLSSSESFSRIPVKYSVFSPKSGSVDGKNFFKDARNRLSYETFALFLSYVKKLNDKAISKERALVELQSVFGDENSDLHEDFTNLLLRKQSEYESSY
jgi:hypothetical protein